MSRTRIRFVKDHGAWLKGDVTQTSSSQAHALVVAGIAEYDGVPQGVSGSPDFVQPLSQSSPDSWSVNERIKEAERELMWPTWLAVRYIQALSQSGLTPVEVRTMPPMRLSNEVANIGPRLAPQIIRDLQLQWTALRVKYNLVGNGKGQR